MTFRFLKWSVSIRRIESDQERQLRRGSTRAKASSRKEAAKRVKACLMKEVRLERGAG